MRKILKFSVIIAALALVCGIFGANMMRAGEPKIDPNLTVMPNLINTDINKVGIKLKELGFDILIIREARNERLENDKIVKIKHVEREFRANEWNHMILKQSPNAGESIKKGDKITFYAGMHHGFGHFDAWVKMHPKSIAMRGGDKRCKECHMQNTCTDCHQKYDIKIK